MKTGKNVLESDEQYDNIFQKKVDESEGYSIQADVDAANNRKPELNENSSSRYKTNTRLAKTVIKSMGMLVKLMIDIFHLLIVKGNNIWKHIILYLCRIRKIFYRLILTERKI